MNIRRAIRGFVTIMPFLAGRLGNPQGGDERGAPFATRCGRDCGSARYRHTAGPPFTIDVAPNRYKGTRPGVPASPSQCRRPLRYDGGLAQVAPAPECGGPPRDTLVATGGVALRTFNGLIWNTDTVLRSKPHQSTRSAAGWPGGRVPSCAPSRSNCADRRAPS